MSLIITSFDECLSAGKDDVLQDRYHFSSLPPDLMS